MTIEDKVEEKPSASPIQHAFKLDIKIYPCKCPNCGTMVEFDKPVYPNMYPIGKTKAKFAARKAKRVVAPKVVMKKMEEY